MKFRKIYVRTGAHEKCITGKQPLLFNIFSMIVNIIADIKRSTAKKYDA